MPVFVAPWEIGTGLRRRGPGSVLTWRLSWVDPAGTASWRPVSRRKVAVCVCARACACVCVVDGGEVESGAITI